MSEFGPIRLARTNCHLSQLPLPLASYNLLSFQQHSRTDWLTAFVFIHIPALLVPFPQPPFVFNDIAASFAQKRIPFAL